MQSLVNRFLASALIASMLASTACAAEDEAVPAEPEKNGDASQYEMAVFAGGCFWCVEADLEKLDGVGDVVSGYAGGETDQPTYQNHEGHLEVVRAPYDPDVISYRALTDYFLRHIDPLDEGGQFCDRGYSYTTAIFVADEKQRKAAQAAIEEAEKALGQPIVTPVRDLDRFWRAEEYHQDYYKKNPVRYKFYRTGCRRDARVEAVWDDR